MKKGSGLLQITMKRLSLLNKLITEGKKMKRPAALLFLLLNSFILSATHNRAGAITYTQLSDLTYEITVTTFTYTKSFADRQQLDVSFGDNSIWHSTAY